MLLDKDKTNFAYTINEKNVVLVWSLPCQKERKMTDLTIRNLSMGL